MPKPYPEEFRRDVIAVARLRAKPLTQIAKDFGISDGLIPQWLRAEQQEQGPGTATATVLETENRELKHKLRVAEQEAEIMLRAVAYLDREVNPK